MGSKLTFVCQVGHPGSLESLAVMLGAAGHQVAVPGSRLRDVLKAAGLDSLYSAAAMAEGWGGRMRQFPEAGPVDMERRDVVYVDTKAHRNAPHVHRRWPHLQGRVLWYRINGGEPDRVKGDEVEPGVPVLTPNLWYSGRTDSYTCWPPFYRFTEFCGVRGAPTDPPVCLVHNLPGYGYQEVADGLPGVRCHGSHGTRDGVTPYRDLPGLLNRAKCYVHLKSVDAPGYALYEAMSSGCPVVVPRRLVARCKMERLLEDRVTCLTFGDDVGLPEGDNVARLVEEISGCCMLLGRNADYNRMIGQGGRERLQRLMWSADDVTDVQMLREFLGRVFP